MKKAGIAFALVMSMLATGVYAETGTTGLGQAWPNTSDVSRSPNYHVYVFHKDGVRYIQVNDAAGNVLGAVAKTGNGFLLLPVGQFADKVVTSSQSSSAGTSSTTVYSDESTTIAATPLSDGTIQLTAAKANDDTTCTDPATCGTKGGS